MAAPETGTERTVGQLFASATADLSALVHDEIALARAEITKDVKRGLAGSGAGVIAGVVALASVPVLSIAAALGIHALGPTLGWSFCIVGGAYLLLAAILGFMSYRFFKKLSPPERTIAGAKATVDVLKGAKPHPAPAIPSGDGHRALTP
jgi:hypothetical protein